MPLALDTSLQYLQGVGPKRAAAFAQAGLRTVNDLLLYFPRRYLDRTSVSSISHLVEGVESTVVGTIRASGIMKGRKARFEATLDDGTGHLQLVFFRYARWLLGTLKKNTVVACTGVPKVFFDLQMVHPQLEILDSEDSELGVHSGRIVPVYPGTSDLAQLRIDSRTLRRLILPVLETDLPEKMSEPLPSSLREAQNLLPIAKAIRQIHFPSSMDDAEQARRRFAFDELFAIQVHLVHLRAGTIKIEKPHHYQPPGPPERQLLDSLPFTLTGDQKKALREIIADVTSPHPMQRLLQGDVGAGKTVVATFAMYLAARSGLQAALMSPTEILAEQHFDTLSMLLGPVGLKPELLTGSLTASEKKRISAGLTDGTMPLVVGTHALIQKSVRFRNLALAVVDEQHRFGVRQRAELAAKGKQVDLLVMTATPIPRTLQLTLYGDLDLTTLRELPPGRAPVTTRVIPETELQKLWQWLEDRFAKSDQAYIVYPIIEESEKQDLKAATAEYERLSREVFPKRRVALVHGRTPTEERRATMAAFRRGKIDLLAATTVIEIGVDIPNANIMVIEHAERFGLSQLHQLRGRIRRGTKHGYCIAVAETRGNVTSRLRLEKFSGTNDGFEIAAADLELRGPGELFGSRQHGILDLKVAKLGSDTQLLEAARKEAIAIIKSDPELRGHEWAALRSSLAEKRMLWQAG
jgi:ATP-dependent DNA helicase RecG